MGYMTNAGYKPRTYFTISKQGEIKQSVRTDSGWDHIAHSAYEGRVVAISKHHNKFDEDQWQVVFENEDGGQDVWQTSVNSKTFALFLSCIAGATNTVRTVTLSPYMNGQYVNLSVLVNGQKTKWKYHPSEFPLVIEVKDKGGKVIGRDYTDRNAWVENTLLPEACKALGIDVPSHEETVNAEGDTVPF